MAAAMMRAALALCLAGLALAACSGTETNAMRRCAAITPIAGEREGMVWVPGGVVRIGEGAAHPEENPAYDTELPGFWIDRHEVTNAQFAAFVEATSYVTEAERQPPAKGGPGSAVFAAGGRPGWAYVQGAHWREPFGPGSSIEGMDTHPVVHVSFADASAYAAWVGRDLPTEEQYEQAVRLGGDEAIGSDADGRPQYRANTWQGIFPLRNTGEDGFSSTAPVGCFEADALGLYDALGNVWEWTRTPYYPQHQAPAAMREAFPNGLNQASPDVGVRVIKGGSFLCAPNFCARYTPSARQPQEADLGSSHIGFRTVLNVPGP